MRILITALLVTACALTLMARSVRQVQTYGIVDKIEFEPNEKSPKKIKIWGAFALLYVGQNFESVNQPGPYGAKRGYLYFKLPLEGQQTALKEWADLKAVAGTGDLVTFGSWPSVYLGMPKKFGKHTGFVANYHGEELLAVQTQKDHGFPPATYTMDTGIVKLLNTGRYEALFKALKEASLR
jgi:hypothetical protein